MADLRTERERRGLSLREVSRVSQIPLQILVALEDGETDRMEPEDLFHYREKYERHLGIRPTQQGVQQEEAPTEFVEFAEETRTHTIPIEDDFPKLRLVIIGFLLTLATVMVLQVGSMLVDRQKEAAMVAPDEQEISLRAINAMQIRLHTESEPQPAQRLGAGESTSLRSSETIIVEVDKLTDVVIHYNGEMIQPLGDQEFPRRLVFIRDAEE